MLTSDKAYRTITYLSLLILVFVQFKLIYNTFELKNNQYYLKEKEVINKYYSQLIRNDKVYPGGHKIIDKHIIENIELFKSMYEKSNEDFLKTSDSISRNMIDELRSRQNMDSIFSEIKDRFELNNNLKYGLYIEQLSLTFDGVHYLPLFSSKDNVQNPALKTAKYIAGTLKNINNQNRVTGLSVNSTNENSYQINFSLYVDQDNRTQQILWSMYPTFILSLFSVVFVVGIFYITYNNWMRQKKLAAMTSDFLNSISHEFNTPIATILVANKSLSATNYSNDNKISLELNAVIDRQAHRLKRLVSQSLMISQLTKANLEKEECDLLAVLMEILEDYSLKLDNNIELIPLFDDNPKEVFLNKFLFTTMIYNLLDNAIKYNKSIHKKIYIHLECEDALIYIRIQDNGVGMNKESVKYIFNKFFRGKNSIEEGGLGLGLYYVQQVIKLHDWKLNVKSDLNEGSVFSVIINAENK